MTLPLLGYQVEGAKFLACHRLARLGLFDEMGVGKTAQAITAAADSLKVKRMIVVCPASVRAVWQGNFGSSPPSPAASSRARASTT